MSRVFYGQELREHIFSGVGQLKQAIAPNFGPEGRNTLYEQENDIPLIMNSGLKVLSQTEPVQSVETLSFRVLREAALKVAREQGDGANAVIVLAQTILKQARRLVEAGAGPVRMRKGILKAAKAAVNEIKRNSVLVEKTEDMIKIAESAAGDAQAAKLAAEACKKAGLDGIINVEYAQHFETVMKSGGIRYDAGYFSSAFANDVTGRRVCLEKPYLMLINQKITSIAQIQRVLEEMISQKSALLMIVQDMTDEVLQLILKNVRMDVFRVVVAHAPGFGNTRYRYMQALSAATGALLIEKDCGLELEACGLEVCRKVGSVELDRDSTCITGTPGKNEMMVENLKKQVNELLEKTTDEETRDEIRTMLGILNGDILVIEAGGATEVEMFERKQHIESALTAVRAGRKGGMIAGGGKAYLLGISAVEAVEEHLYGDELLGAECLKEALNAPVREIAENGGYDGRVIATHLLHESAGIGFNVQTGRYEDMLEAGIVDAVNVVCAALETAAVVAGQLLTVEAAVC